MIAVMLRTGWLNLKRDRVALALTFVLPILFFSIFALVFEDLDGSGATAPVDAVVIDVDGGDEAARFAEFLASDGALHVDPAVPAGGRDAALDSVARGRVPVAVVIPAGFGAPVEGQAQVEVLVDSSHPMAAAAANAAIRGAAVRLGIEDADAIDSSYASDSWVRVEDVLGREGKRPSTAYFAAGIGVMFLLFAVSGRSAILIEERDSGVLTRLLASRLGMTRFLLGRWLFLAILGAAQVTLMFVWGALVFGLDLWTPRNLVGFTLLTAVTAAAAAGFGVMLATACRTRAQLNGVAAVVILLMSALGGSVFPRFLMSDSMQAVGRLTFNAWALDGYRKVFWYDTPMLALWPEIAVLSGMGLAFLVTARILARRWETV